MDMQWDGTCYPAQVYFTTFSGGVCGGTAYLNDGSGGGAVIWGKTAYWVGSKNSFMVPSTVETSGISLSVPFYAAGIDNPTCGGAGNDANGWLLKTITNSELGLPTTITAPLVLQ
ncbi:hypothetical protein [Holophaga foetida]|uniref:hypothetical protein n=1 Tax=Holophaga foetida TaxID=35839 RepID=UPI001B7FB871|nr:hypothetical protein [Holophaga foetida]